MTATKKHIFLFLLFENALKCFAGNHFSFPKITIFQNPTEAPGLILFAGLKVAGEVKQVGIFVPK